MSLAYAVGMRFDPISFQMMTDVTSIPPGLLIRVSGLYLRKEGVASPVPAGGHRSKHDLSCLSTDR